MDNKELNDIIRQQTPRLRNFVRGRVKNREDADDIVQDTLYQFLRTISILDNPIGQVTSWLYTVAQRLIINHGKKMHESPLPESDRYDGDSILGDLSEIMMSEDTDNPEIQLLRSMVWKELDKAMESLPPEQREAIEMTEIEGLSVKEAAERMNIPLNTFLSRKHYAVLHIRKRLHTLYHDLIEN